jgi:uncharacterized protein
LINEDIKESLHLAALKGHTSVIKALLDKFPNSIRKAYLEDPNEEGLTPLHLAAQGGSAEAIELLLEKGAKSGKVNHQTALHVASQYGRPEVIKVLLRRGAEVNEVAYLLSEVSIKLLLTS